MYGRLENRSRIRRLSQLSRPARPIRISHAEAKYAEHYELLESLWNTCLTLGREPSREEVPDALKLIEAFGSIPASLRFIKARKENVAEIFSSAQQSRMDDLRVYFAQLQFQKRKPYKSTAMTISSSKTVSMKLPPLAVKNGDISARQIS